MNTVPAEAPVPRRAAPARDPAGTPLDTLVTVFGLLAEPGRLRLLLALAEQGECGVGELAARAGLAPSAASHALRLLRAARIVAYRRSGRRVIYSLRDHHVRTLLAVALEHWAGVDA